MSEKIMLMYAALTPEQKQIVCNVIDVLLRSPDNMERLIKDICAEKLSDERVEEILCKTRD